jgi:hypothetical protein
MERRCPLSDKVFLSLCYSQVNCRVWRDSHRGSSIGCSLILQDSGSIHISFGLLTETSTGIFRAHADDFYVAISSSSMSSDEAFWAYMLYLRPKLTYPLPCTSFTEAQCRKIQAPALAALLPKLHLNRHSACNNF